MANISNQGVPPPNYPFVDSDGKINTIWLQFLTSLWIRTGQGSNLGDVTATSVTSSGPITATNGTFSGNMQFGTYASGTFNQTGYIILFDDTGTVRRVMVG